MYEQYLKQIIEKKKGRTIIVEINADAVTLEIVRTEIGDKWFTIPELMKIFSLRNMQMTRQRLKRRVSRSFNKSFLQIKRDESKRIKYFKLSQYAKNFIEKHKTFLVKCK